MSVSMLKPDEIRGLSLSELYQIQLSKLRTMAVVVGRENPFYRVKFEAAGLDPSGIESLDDLKRLPFTTKKSLTEDQLNHPRFGTNLTYPLGTMDRNEPRLKHPLRWANAPVGVGSGSQK